MKNKNFRKRAQGALDYLLITGAVMLVAAIVITAMTGVSGEGKKGTNSSEYSTSKDILRCNLDIAALGLDGTISNNYVCCNRFVEINTTNPKCPNKV
jgi:uncharacterized protein (UPF0333 family)